MKVAVVCANGRVGRLVVKEAIDRGLDVTAIAKGKNESAAEKYVCKDLFDLTTADLEDVYKRQGLYRHCAADSAYRSIFLINSVFLCKFFPKAPRLVCGDEDV